MREIYNCSSVINDLNVNRKKYYKWFKCVSLLLMLLVISSTSAQVNDYVFSQSTGNYTSIANNGVLVTGSDATYSTNNDTQGWNVTLPFSFKFNNIHYTSIYVNSNGGATFGNVNSTASSLISSISSYSGAIAVMNRDLWGVFVTGGKTTSGSNVITNVVSFEGIRIGVNIASGAGIQENTYIMGYDTVAKTITMSKNATSSFTNAAVRCGSGRILLKVDGVSPNRTFTIQWEGYNDNHTEPVGSNYLSFQLKLIEGTHQIQMVYGNHYSIYTYPRDAQVGLRGVSNTDFNNRAGDVTNSWLNTSAGTSNTATVSRNNINFPASGLTFTWTPFVTTTIPNCITASSIIPTNNTTGITNKTFTWPVASGGVSGYKLYVGSNESASNLINGLDVGNVLTHTSTTIDYLPNTQYFWKVVPYNEFGDAMDCTVWNYTTLNVPNCPTITFPAANATNIVRNTTLTWTAPTNPSATSYDVYFGTSSNPSFVANVTGTAYTPNAMLANTTYYWKVVSKNSMGGSQECVVNSFTTGPNLVYCTPSSTNWNTYINNFSTSLGTTNISNLNSGYYTGGYQNYYDQSAVTSYATGTFNYNFSIIGGSLGAAIWIDWNSNGAFETSERVFVTSSYVNGPFSGTINVPVGTAIGDYRMRVLVDYSNSAPSNPCITSNPRTETEDYKFTVSVVPGCIEPTILTASNVETTAATLNWTASISTPTNGYDIYYSTLQAAPSTGTAPTVNNHAASPRIIMGLSPSSTYYWWVRSDCGDTSVWVPGGSFTTAQIPATLPYSEDFSGTNGFSFVNGTEVNKWVNGAVVGNTGNSIYISNDAGVTNAYSNGAPSVTQAYRDITIPAGTTAGNLSFDWRANGEVSWDYLSVWLVPESFIPTAGTKITTGSGRIQVGSYFVLKTTWQNYNSTLNLSSFANSTMRLVFEWSNDGGGGQQTPAAIDNVSLTIPTCVAPTTLISSSITATTVTLSWTGPTSTPANGFDVYYSTTNTAPLAGTTPTFDNYTASPLNATGLSSSSTYYWWVRSDCGGETSAWMVGGSFVTPCEPLIAPTAVQDFQTFNGTAPSPTCWTEATGTLALNTTLSGTTSGWLLKPNGFANVSNVNKGFSINLYSTKNEWMISPPIDLSSTAGLYRLKYRYAVTSYNSTGVQSTLGTHKVNVVISTDGGATWSNTNSIKTYTGAGTYSNTGAFETINLTAYSGIVKIAFVASTTTTSPDIDFHIDDFSVEEIPVLPPNCAAGFLPADLATGINRNSTLSWTEATGTPASYDVYFGTTSNPAFVVNTTSTNYTPITLANTTYFWKVVPKNANGDAIGCTEQSFTTGTNINYCAPTYVTGPGTGDFITNVTLGTLNNTSASNSTAPFYTFFNAVTIPSIQKGANAEVSITFSTDGAQFGGAWIDFNNDGVFDASEGKVSTIDADASGTTVLIFNVPTDAVVGNTRMRVRGGEDVALTTSQACGASSSSYGETEDYIVNIIVPCPEWTGAVNTAWNVAENWCDNTVPSALTNVIINSANPLVISSDVTVASMSLGSSANVTLNGTLNVGNISVASGGQMIVANDAAILQNSEATNAGLVTVKRNSTDLFRQDYTLWSSPVIGQNLRAFSPQTLFNRFSSYDTAAGTSGAYLQEIITTADMNTKTFTNAKGYLIRMPNNWVEVGSSNPAQPYLGSFTGTLNNGTVSIALSGANSKLNLVGNPYASPISINAFFEANSDIVNNTLYFWRKKGSELSGASGYATYTSLGLVSADASINGTSPTNIEVGQGFFVIANSVTPGNLVFNNTMRNNGAATFYKSSNDNTAELHRFWLNLSNATNVVGQTLIGYKTGATQGIDAGVDALYFNDNATALTSLIDNSEYIIQGRNVPFVDTDIVPLGFKSDVAGSFTIGLSNFDGLFAENQAIYLKDNSTGTLHNLKLSDYTFTTSIGVFNNRFEVQYSSTLGTNNPELAGNTILIGVKDQKININAGTITMDKIELIDVAGRVIYTKEGVNATTARLENVVSSNQMLIVRISTKENGLVSQKIIF